MTAVATFKDIVPAETFEQIRSLVRRSFPDPKTPDPTDALVDAVLDALPPEARQALGIAKTAFLAASTLTDAAIRAVGAAHGVAQVDAHATASYFLARATHTRHGLGKHEFTAELPMVRVELPESQPTDFNTHFGIVFAGDHKVHTRALLEAKYEGLFSFPVGKIFLTTPARCFGARFAAIATYEVQDEDGVNRAWVLEAGMATGEPVMLYMSPNGQPVPRQANYSPTPFSDSLNWYRGAASFDEFGPSMLHVQVSTPEERKQKQVHMEVKVVYEPVPATDASSLAVFPSKLTAQAALRVAAIAVARGQADAVMTALAPFADALDWTVAP